jgi:hypothetical protein
MAGCMPPAPNFSMGFSKAPMDHGRLHVHSRRFFEGTFILTKAIYSHGTWPGARGQWFWASSLMACLCWTGRILWLAALCLSPCMHTLRGSLAHSMQTTSAWQSCLKRIHKTGQSISRPQRGRGAEREKERVEGRVVSSWGLRSKLWCKPGEPASVNFVSQSTGANGICTRWAV